MKKEFACEELKGGPRFNRVRQIGNDHIPTAGVGDDIERISNFDSHSRVIQRSLMNFWQELSARIDRITVDIDQQNFFDVIPFQRFTGRTTIRTSRNQDSTRLTMQYEWGMDKWFVIQELVTSTGLPAPVENESFSVNTTFDDVQFLAGCLPMDENLTDTMLPDIVGRKGFTDPALLSIHRNRTCWIDGSMTLSGHKGSLIRLTKVYIRRQSPLRIQ